MSHFSPLSLFSSHLSLSLSLSLFEGKGKRNERGIYRSTEASEDDDTKKTTTTYIWGVGNIHSFTHFISFLLWEEMAGGRLLRSSSFVVFNGPI